MDLATLLASLPATVALGIFAVFGVAAVIAPWLPVPKNPASFYGSFHSALGFLAHNYGNAANALHINPKLAGVVTGAAEVSAEAAAARTAPVVPAATPIAAVALAGLLAFSLSACGVTAWVSHFDPVKTNADAVKLLQDVTGMEQQLVASVPAADVTAAKNAFAAIATDVQEFRSGTGSVTTAVADVAELAAIVAPVVPDFEKAITDDKAVVSAGMQQLQADAAVLKADLGLGGQVSLAGLRAGVRAH